MGRSRSAKASASSCERYPSSAAAVSDHRRRRVVRDAPDDAEAGRAGGDGGLDEARDVAGREPGGQRAGVGRLLEARADPQADDVEAVAVVVEAAQRLAGHLRDAVEGVRPGREVVADGVDGGVEADRVVAAREHHARHPGAAGGLEDGERAVDVDVEDLAPRRLAADPAEVHDRVGAPAGLGQRVEVGDRRRHHLLPLPGVVDGGDVEEAQRAVGAAQAGAQHAADAPRGAGDQEGLGHVRQRGPAGVGSRRRARVSARVTGRAGRPPHVRGTQRTSGSRPAGVQCP